MNRNNKQLCYSIKNAILDSFEEEGYLKGTDLDEYIKECVSIEIPKKYKSEIQEFIDVVKHLIFKDEIYNELLSGKTLMCSKCGLIKPISRFNTYIYNGKKSNKNICKKCEYKVHRKWVNKNRDKQKQYNKTRYESNTEYYKEKQNDWRLNNPELHRLYNKKYKARVYIKNKLNRELTTEEHNLINKLVKYENLTGLKILKSGVIK